MIYVLDKGMCGTCRHYLPGMSECALKSSTDIITAHRDAYVHLTDGCEKWKEDDDYSFDEEEEE